MRRPWFQAPVACDVKPPKDGKFESLPRSFAAATYANHDIIPDAESLLDDDPFADLTGGPRGGAPRLQDPTFPLAKTLPRSPPSQQYAPTKPRTVSQTHTRPTRAFKPRPSLPWLHALAIMSQHKIRRSVDTDLPSELRDIEPDVVSATPPSQKSKEEIAPSTKTAPARSGKFLDLNLNLEPGLDLDFESDNFSGWDVSCSRSRPRNQ
ncbi:hypothetical protein B0H14DRAFT_3597970 [Mycena olivaceomarginata]|nr:hypothetical protein B0H14DRAFT_3597970 [Mycena olivaceomarginata]